MGASKTGLIQGCENDPRYLCNSVQLFTLTKECYSYPQVSIAVFPSCWEYSLWADWTMPTLSFFGHEILGKLAEFIDPGGLWAIPHRHTHDPTHHCECEEKLDICSATLDPGPGCGSLHSWNNNPDVMRRLWISRVQEEPSKAGNRYMKSCSSINTEIPSRALWSISMFNNPSILFSSLVQLQKNHVDPPSAYLFYTCSGLHLKQSESCYKLCPCVEAV